MASKKTMSYLNTAFQILKALSMYFQGMFHHRGHTLYYCKVNVYFIDFLLSLRHNFLNWQESILIIPGKNYIFLNLFYIFPLIKLTSQLMQ